MYKKQMRKEINQIKLELSSKNKESDSSSKLQISAQKENWALYLLKGFHSAACVFIKPVISKTVWTSLNESIVDTIWHIKFIQKDRMNKVGKEPKE